jgi:hypothetical protein
MKSAPHARRARLFTLECDRCSELITDYIAAANNALEIRLSSHLAGPAIAREIDKIQKLRSHARHQLLIHKSQEH